MGSWEDAAAVEAHKVMHHLAQDAASLAQENIELHTFDGNVRLRERRKTNRSRHVRARSLRRRTRRWRRRMPGQGPGPNCRVWWALESPKGPNVELGGPLGALKSLNVKLGGPLRAPRLPNVNHTLAKPHLHTSPIIARVTKGVESCIQPLLLRQYESV